MAWWGLTKKPFENAAGVETACRNQPTDDDRHELKVKIPEYARQTFPLAMVVYRGSSVFWRGEAGVDKIEDNGQIAQEVVERAGSQEMRGIG